MKPSCSIVPISCPTTSRVSSDVPISSGFSTFSKRSQCHRPTRSSKASIQPVYKYRAVWRRALFKIKIRLALKKVKDDILVYGTSHELTDATGHYKGNIDELIEQKKKKEDVFRKFMPEIYCEKMHYPWLFHPDGTFKKLWNIVLIAFMVYTAMIMPYRIAFQEEVFWDAWTVLDLLLDLVFLADIVITFFSITQNDNGVIEFHRGRIAVHYLKSWFLIDVISCVPMTLVDYFSGADNENSASKGKYNSLMRLARLPRLYKLLRIVRVLKVVKHYSQSQIFERFQDCLHINSLFVCVHVMGCFWYFSAKMVDFEPDTWVVRYSLQDASNRVKYMTAIYWAVTTAATVGYGDIVPGNNIETALAILWMVIGVGFYSFTVGSLSSFMMSIDTRDSLLSMKIASVQEFARQVGLTPEVKVKIREALKYNAYRTGNVWSDKHSLFKELPKSLRHEVAWSMYDGIAKDFPVFRFFEGSLLAAMMPMLQPMRLNDGDFVYVEGDYADQIFFVTRGRVNFVLLPSEVAYKSFLRGSYIGEIEILKRVSRLNTAICCNSCEFLTLAKADFNLVICEFPAEAKVIRQIACEKANRNKQSMLETMELLKLKATNGSVSQLAGKERFIKVEQEDEKEYSVFTMLEEKTSSIEANLKDHKNSLQELTVLVSNTQRLIARALKIDFRWEDIEEGTEKANSDIE